jgi:hypothetical protein
MRDHFGKVLGPGDSVRYHDRDGRSLLATVVTEAANGSCVVRLGRGLRPHLDLVAAAPVASIQAVGVDERELFEADGADLTYVIARSDRWATQAPAAIGSVM